MTLAFYAPMKPPNHTVASGDRTIARHLLAALEHAGYNVELVATFQSREGRGNAEVQSTLITQAEALLPQLIGKGRASNWRAWITYHNYYKAPDLLGPAVARALGIPYLQIEATRARKRLGGPWDRFAKAAENATDAADAVFYFTRRDAEALSAYAPAGQSLVHLRPFLPHTHAVQRQKHEGPMLSVAMLRRGDKLHSYELIAAALAQLTHAEWHLEIAGDGPARPEIEALFAPFGAHVRFLGLCDAKNLQAAYARAGLFLWPGVNEAFGMAYLEAQAAGLPIVAQNRPGVCDVLPPGPYPEPDEGPTGLARMLEKVHASPQVRARMSAHSRENFESRHTLEKAATVLRSTLEKLGVAA